jgi:RNase H-like domain found in reverse transcriptase
LANSKIRFEWNQEQETAFTQLKEAVMNTPILRCADSSLPYEVQADDYETGIGAVLQQKDDNSTLL